MICLELPIPPLPQLLKVDHVLWMPGMQHYERSFQVYDVLIVVRGTLYMTEEDRPYEIGEGSLLILEPGKTHVGHRPVETETEIYYLHFIHPAARRLVEHDRINWPQPLRQGADDDTAPSEQFMYLPKFTRLSLLPLLPVLDEMVRLHRSFSMQNALRLQVLSGELLTMLQHSDMQQIQTRTFELSKQTIVWLEKHMTEPFESERMERDLNFNADYLARCLKQYTGMTPLQYLRYIQVEKAKRYLLQGGCSVREAGEKVGLPEPNYFVRLFRKQTGMTPGTFRKTHAGYM